MKGMSLNKNILRLASIIGIVVLFGCSNGNDTAPLPTNEYTLSFTSTGASLNYSLIDVKVDVPVEAIAEGETVPLGVKVQPTNLPERAFAGSIFERIGWLSLENKGDPDIALLKEMSVYFPLDGGYIPNENYIVFYFNESSGKWSTDSKAATVTDTGTHAIFTADKFGTWGVFKIVPLKVDATASRTTAKAPASITLTAVIDGGAPPYTVSWWFGDDSDPMTGLSAGHFYEDPITYTSCCIVLDSVGHEVSDYIDLNLY